MKTYKVKTVRYAHLIKDGFPPEYELRNTQVILEDITHLGIEANWGVYICAYETDQVTPLLGEKIEAAKTEDAALRLAAQELTDRSRRGLDCGRSKPL